MLFNFLKEDYVPNYLDTLESEGKLDTSLKPYSILIPLAGVVGLIALAKMAISINKPKIIIDTVGALIGQQESQK